MLKRVSGSNSLHTSARPGRRRELLPATNIRSGRVDPTARLIAYFVSSGFGPRASLACLSASSRLISVTSCNNFLGSLSTEARRQSSVQRSGFCAGTFGPRGFGVSGFETRFVFSGSWFIPVLMQRAGYRPPLERPEYCRRDAENCGWDKRGSKTGIQGFGWRPSWTAT